MPSTDARPYRLREFGMDVHGTLSVSGESARPMSVYVRLVAHPLMQCEDTQETQNTVVGHSSGKRDTTTRAQTGSTNSRAERSLGSAVWFRLNAVTIAHLPATTSMKPDSSLSCHDTGRAGLRARRTEQPDVRVATPPDTAILAPGRPPDESVRVHVWCTRLSTGAGHRPRDRGPTHLRPCSTPYRRSPA
jgi:hypothetical protein